MTLGRWQLTVGKRLGARLAKGVALSKFGALDKRVDALLDAPVGSVFERTPEEEEFAPVTDWSPEEQPAGAGCSSANEGQIDVRHHCATLAGYGGRTYFDDCRANAARVAG
jgi:hypothetical protein